MIKNLEEQKARITEEMVNALEKYYEAFESSSNQEGFDINKIERLMLENQRKIRKVLEEANNELVSSVEVGTKKNAPDVEIN
jgi:hypothetical protein